MTFYFNALNDLLLQCVERPSLLPQYVERPSTTLYWTTFSHLKLDYISPTLSQTHFQRITLIMYYNWQKQFDFLGKTDILNIYFVVIFSSSWEGGGGLDLIKYCIFSKIWK